MLLQAEVDRSLKDVKEQRDQLYRKLDLLKAKGIEILGPNMSVLKTDLPTPGEKMDDNESKETSIFHHGLIRYDVDAITTSRVLHL